MECVASESISWIWQEIYPPVLFWQICRRLSSGPGLPVEAYVPLTTQTCSTCIFIIGNGPWIDRDSPYKRRQWARSQFLSFIFPTRRPGVEFSFFSFFISFIRLIRSSVWTPCLPSQVQHYFLLSILESSRKYDPSPPNTSRRSAHCVPLEKCFCWYVLSYDRCHFLKSCWRGSTIASPSLPACWREVNWRTRPHQHSPEHWMFSLSERCCVWPWFRSWCP